MLNVIQNKKSNKKQTQNNGIVNVKAQAIVEQGPMNCLPFVIFQNFFDFFDMRWILFDRFEAFIRNQLTLLQ